MKPERWQRVDEIIRLVLELDEPERAAFLDRTCADDGALRAEVEALIAADALADGFLEQPAVRQRPGAGAPASPPATLPDGAAEPGAGWCIGAYRVIRCLGEGGMGAVHLAVRSDAEYDRAVAIKVLRPGLQGRGLVRRFRSERQILASLDHPHIARLHDGGTMPDGRPYLVMEYIAGTPIDRHAEERHLPIRARLALFRRVCEAVHYAHQNLILHLDIKPGNILVNEDGAPKLLDFGIAKLLPPDGSSRAGEATHTGPRPLTPRYASPEQLRGQPLTTASDVYSLGVVLHELLTGSIPAHPDDPAPVPHTRPADRSHGGRRHRQLTGDLESIVGKALRDEPQHRYGSAEQLSADLERHLDGRPVEARKGTTMYRLGKFLRRYKLVVAAVTAFLTLVLAFAASTALQATRLAEERRRADQQRQNAEEVLAFLVKLFELADPLQAAGGAPSARALLDQGADRLDQELQAQPAVQVKLRETLGTIYINLGSYDRAAVLLHDALQRAEQLAEPDDVQVAAILSRLASVYLFQGQHDRAEPLYLRALDLRQRHLDPDHIDLAESLHNLASCYFAQGRFEHARELFERALAIARAGPAAIENRLQTAFITGALAAVYWKQGDHARAERLYLDVIRIYEESYGQEHPDLAYAWNDLARVYMDTGELARAAPLLARAAQVTEKTQGAQHPHLAIILYNHASLHQRQGDLAQAEALHLRALRIRETATRSGHPDVCDSLRALRDVYTRMDRAQDAEAMRARLSAPQLEACATAAR